MPSAKPGKQTKVSKHGGGKAVKKALKVKGGTASRYTTRNAALNRLQLKLADFRRLCILKGIHPRCARLVPLVRGASRRTRASDRASLAAAAANRRFSSHATSGARERPASRRPGSVGESRSSSEHVHTSDARAWLTSGTRARSRASPERRASLTASPPSPILACLDVAVVENRRSSRTPELVPETRFVTHREPKKKVKGQGKTYYHVKDINFLAHEPLLDTFRALRAYERKIKKAKAKQAYHAVDRLEERKPQYGLDHLVKERYPSFGDALRDFDDPLTLTHLFAMLPADKRHGIPAELVTRSRALALEFQAWVTKTHALRKAFISVKGIYYQALVHGQEVTWLTPHALHQTLPEDVDYRVMLTFLEFYLAMMGFVNYKLYHDRALRYPPLLDTKLEDDAAGIVAVIHDLADTVSKVKQGKVVTAAKRGDAQATATEARMKTLDFAAIGGGGGDDDEEAEAERRTRGRDGDDDDDARSDEDAAAAAASTDDEEAMEEAIASAAGLDPEQREDAKICASLFKGLVFFLNRETPRDAMVFIIRAFGGEVCWEGEGSPYDERDGGVTHHVCDRPLAKDQMKPQREYVQPQWVVDCANWRVLIPTAEYAPGAPPPPHLSPFVDADDEGYTPDYQQTLMRLRAQAKAAREGRSLAEDPDADAPARLLTAEEEAAEEERAYARDLGKEVRGVPYSRAAAAAASDEEGSSDEESDGEEDVAIEANDDDSDDDSEEDDDDSDDDSDAKTKTKRKRAASALTPEMAMREKDLVVNKRIKSMGEEEEMDAMRHVMLPRKKRELYRAMQLGLAKKETRADELRRRKEALKAEGKYGHGKAEAEAEKPAAKKDAEKPAAKKKPGKKK